MTTHATPRTPTPPATPTTSPTASPATTPSTVEAIAACGRPFLTRATATRALGGPRAQRGVLVCSPDTDVVAPLSSDDRESAIERSVRTLRAAGITHRDRSIIALNNDGDGPGALLADAAARAGEAAASVGPRGRMRLLRAIQAVGATTLVTTPTGAADLLARLHLEFLVDPEDLGLQRLVLLGELTAPSSYAHLGAEFAVEVVELWCDPIYGVALGHRRPERDPGFAVDGGEVGLAALTTDALVAPERGERAEWVVAPTWSRAWDGHVLRTGWVAEGGGATLPAPTHTIGEHVLVRGRWLSLPALDQALQRIDGVSGWSLEVERTGTLDRATLHVVMSRPSLVDNPMWTKRIQDATRAMTPILFETAHHGPDDGCARDAVVDRRGHHLSNRRDAVDVVSEHARP
jgi:hypothetical protein